MEFEENFFIAIVLILFFLVGIGICNLFGRIVTSPQDDVTQ